jgi:hypothetical protein
MRCRTKETFEAIRWTGDNTAEVAELIARWQGEYFMSDDGYLCVVAPVSPVGIDRQTRGAIKPGGWVGAPDGILMGIPETVFDSLFETAEATCSTG